MDEQRHHDDEVLTAAEAAAYLRMALSTLYRHVRHGKLPCFRVGNRWRFKRSALDQWIDASARPPVRSIPSNARVVGSMPPRSTMKETTMSDRDTTKQRPDDQAHVAFDLGLGGIFKGLGSLLELASELGEKAGGTEFTREGQAGSSGDKDFRAVYGFSVKVGGSGRPTVEHFGNVRDSKDRGPVVDDVREPLVDTFDEGDFLLIIAEMPGVDAKDIVYEAQGDILTIKAQTAERKYAKEVLLPHAVDPSQHASSYQNGILEIKIWKSQQ